MAALSPACILVVSRLSVFQPGIFFFIPLSTSHPRNAMGFLRRNPMSSAWAENQGQMIRQRNLEGNTLENPGEPP